MYKALVLSVLFCLLFTGQQLVAQDLKTNVRDNKELDSLRKQLDSGEDSVVYTSKYVRFTTLRLTEDSIQTFPLDTSLRNFQNYSPISEPLRPTIGLGNLGLPVKPLLFEPNRTIGFDLGFHSLDAYALTHDDIMYYQARTPFSNLYYMGAGRTEQIFRVTVGQNVKKNWSVGANYVRMDANGIYDHQRGDDLNAALFSWYESPNKRYNVFASAVFNTLKAEENGSLFGNLDSLDDNVSTDALPVNLTSAKQISRRNSVLIRQSYFIGRIDTVDQEVSQKVLPTNKISYLFTYTNETFSFFKNEDDAGDREVLPPGLIDPRSTNDSTNVKHLSNQFIYGFFLRGKSQSFIKNELKVDVGIRHDYYKYMQQARYPDLTNYYLYNSTFQNASLLGSLGYRFSNRIDLNVDLQQIFQGRQAGDYLYEAKSNVLIGDAVGRIVLGAYMENKSPAEVYNRYFGNHYNWINDFDRTNTINFNFAYLNDRYRFEVGAEYFLIDNYLYFGQDGDVGIKPMQNDGSLNLLKVKLGKKFKFGKFNLDSYVMYQKTDQDHILRTPELYTFNSFFMNQTFFKVLKTDVGFDLRYNTAYLSYAYSPAASQFYLPTKDNRLKSEPILDVWVRASLRKANLFVKYDYVNMGLFADNYQTVENYLMPQRMLKFGVSWNFYD
ncbi:putative porin [Pedobacter sp.]|uniref:putative porin n=1 Tax=Pedobacter sp. TaxID=1411316 RepID=UPI003D7F8BFE